jgi:hypothetical protein
MSLPASQRRILEKIENALRGSDPRLTSLFAIFSRLNIDEEMPRIEQLRARASLHLVRLHHRLGAAGRWPGAKQPRRRAAFFFPLALVIVASTFVVAAALPGHSRCAAAAAVADAARHGARVRTCKKPHVIDPVMVGK